MVPITAEFKDGIVYLVHRPEKIPLSPDEAFGLLKALAQSTEELFYHVEDLKIKAKKALEAQDG